jgi:hypothetical protein
MEPHQLPARASPLAARSVRAPPVRVELPGLLPLARRLLVRLKRVLPFALAFLLLLLVTPAAFAQTGAGGGGGDGSWLGPVCGCICGLIVVVGFGLIPVVSLWKIFEKAGKPGWAGLVPIYNIIVLMEIIEKPEWLIFMFIPCANIYFGIMATIELAKKFGKDTTFAIGMLLLPLVFYPILAFGKAQYQGRGAAPRDV